MRSCTSATKLTRPACLCCSVRQAGWWRALAAAPSKSGAWTGGHGSQAMLPSVVPNTCVAALVRLLGLTTHLLSKGNSLPLPKPAPCVTPPSPPQERTAARPAWPRSGRAVPPAERHSAGHRGRRLRAAPLGPAGGAHAGGCASGLPALLPAGVRRWCGWDEGWTGGRRVVPGQAKTLWG